LLILVALLFLGCVEFSFFDEDNIVKCGGDKYTSGNQICDDGILKNPCGNDYYDPGAQFCSEQDNKVYNKCDGKNYNPLSTDQICEDNILKTKCGEDYYNPATQFCKDDNIYDKCDGKDYNPLSIDQICEDNILKTKCGEDYYNPATQFCKDAKIYDKCGGWAYDPLKDACCNNTPFILATHECKNGIVYNKCGDEIFDPFIEYCLDNFVREKEKFIDNRDGKTYKYVTIGDQIWMAENLRYETTNTKCYDDNPDNCKTFGVLYDWESAKMACPSGWHLPNNTEWNKLRNFAGNNAGRKLKANGDFWGDWPGWSYGKGSDDFGFTALPSGYSSVYFLKIGEETSFWSATTGIDTEYTSAYSLNGNSTTSTTLNYVEILTNHPPNTNRAIVRISVRCIKD